MIPRLVNTIDNNDEEIKKLQGFYRNNKQLGSPASTETYTVSIQKTRYELSTVQGIGGQSIVFNVKNQPDIVIKVIYVIADIRRTAAENEVTIANDIGSLKKSGGVIFGASNDTNFGENMGFYFLVMPKLAQSLDQLLTQENEREDLYDLAIKTCLCVHQFHHGTSSASKTPRAHLDIKPQNFLLDKQKNVHLIDFSEATETLDAAYYIENEKWMKDGSPMYQAPWGALLSHQQADILALMRTLYLPEYFADAKGKVERKSLQEKENNYLFKSVTDEAIAKLLDTYNVENGQLKSQDNTLRDFPSALELAAKLVLLKLNMPVQNEILLEKLTQLEAILYQQILVLLALKHPLTMNKEVVGKLSPDHAKSKQYHFFTDEKIFDYAKYISTARAVSENILKKIPNVLQLTPEQKQEIHLSIAQSLLDIQASPVPKYAQYIAKHLAKTTDKSTVTPSPQDPAALREEAIMILQLAAAQPHHTTLHSYIDQAVERVIQMGLKNPANTVYLTLFSSSINNRKKNEMTTIHLSETTIKTLKRTFFEERVPQFFERGHQFGSLSLKKFAASILLTYYAQDIEKFQEGIKLFDGTSYVKALCEEFGKNRPIPTASSSLSLDWLEKYINIPEAPRKCFSIGLFKPSYEATGIQEIRALYQGYQQHQNAELFFQAAQAIAKNRLTHRMSGLFRSTDTDKLYQVLNKTSNLDNAATTLSSLP